MNATRLAAAVLSLASAVACGSFQLVPGRSAVLAPSTAESFKRLCSRPGIPDFEGTWLPSRKDVASLESAFGRLRGLRAQGCCVRGGRVEDVNGFFRQYVGIVVEGRRLIYVNAYPVEGDSEVESEPVVSWCDGGESFWGVLFDVRDRRFFDLAFNGLA